MVAWRMGLVYDRGRIIVRRVVGSVWARARSFGLDGSSGFCLRILVSGKRAEVVSISGDCLCSFWTVCPVGDDAQVHRATGRSANCPGMNSLPAWCKNTGPEDS